MASVDRRPNGKWRARWREYPGGPQTAKHFARKLDAERFLVDVQHRMLSGAYVAPEKGKIRLRDYGADWLVRRRPTWRPSTAERYERELRIHIVPSLGRWPLEALRREHVERWAAGLPLAPSSVETVAETLRSVLAAAVADGRIAANPATGAKLPQAEVIPLVPLTELQIRRFAHSAPEHMRAAVLLDAGTGLRQGELFGLAVDRIDFDAGLLRVDQQLWTPKRGPAVLAPLKSKNSYRTITVNRVVLDGLRRHLDRFGLHPDGLVFHTGPGGLVVRAQASRYARTAGVASGLGRLINVEGKGWKRYDGPTWHDLRHFHASMLLSKGISPAYVAERLGHDVKTLLRTYAHVIRQDDERVRAIVEDVLGVSAEDWLRTEAA